MTPATRNDRVGVDTGGTFTDVVRLGRRGMEVHKVPSTPSDPAQAVLDGLASARHHEDEAVDVVHGTTVGLNAALMGKLARTAFVTNRGFEDLIEIGRQDRPDIYALQPERAAVPVPRTLRFGVAARRDPSGKRVVGFAPDELGTLLRALRRAKVDAVAIGLLHSPLNPADERAVARALRPLGVPTTCSAELSPHGTEFERFATAILNAGMAPIMGHYMSRLQREVGPGSLRLMRSSGGILPPEVAARDPARAAFSGPAGGVVATAALMATRAEGDRAGGAGTPSLAAAFDMGGTSTDVCLVAAAGAGGLHNPAVSTLAGLPLALPAVDIHTVGCGGGSIAFADPGGALRVGPDSAGAHPGPACYGTGDRPTVTDAHMALGHMDGDTLLRGAFPVDPDRSVRAIERLGRQLGLSALATARGILEIAEVNMLRALLAITAARAVDPSAVTLVAYGGAGGLHAVGLMERLGMPAALVPTAPGAFSAVGLALAQPSIELSRAVLRPLDSGTEQELKAMARDLAELAPHEATARRQRVAASVGLRYAGQGTTLDVALRGRGSLVTRFTAAHQSLYGFQLERSIEVVQLDVRMEGAEGAARLRPLAATTAASRGHRRRRAPLGGTVFDVWDRLDLSDGNTVRGPCLIDELTGVTVVPRGFQATASPFALELGSSK